MWFDMNILACALQTTPLSLSQVVPFMVGARRSYVSDSDDFVTSTSSSSSSAGSGSTSSSGTP